LQKSGSRILDFQGKEYVNGPTLKWLVPAGVVFLLALESCSSIGVDLFPKIQGYSAKPAERHSSTRLCLPHNKGAASNRQTQVSRKYQSTRPRQYRPGWQLQLCADNSCDSIQGSHGDQKRGIAEFLNTLPPSVLVTIGGVYGCGDAVSYAGEFFPLFQARYLDNQTSPSIRTGFPTTFTDVFVATRTEEDSATKYRNAFADALNGLGIPAHRANGSKVPPGDLDFLVGFRPQEVK
jgi:hypothetical protein